MLYIWRKRNIVYVWFVAKTSIFKFVLTSSVYRWPCQSVSVTRCQKPHERVSPFEVINVGCLLSADLLGYMALEAPVTKLGGNKFEHLG